MTDPSLLLKSALIGASIAAPVGPMSLLCMRRTLARGWQNGLAIGGGIALGDGIYGAIAAFGLAGISLFLLSYERPLHVIAGLTLLFLGLKSLWPRTGEVLARIEPERGWLQDLLTAFALTLSNPPTLLMFAAVFTSLAPRGGFHLDEAILTALGVLLGSLAWWGLLVAIISRFKHALDLKARNLIDKISGAVLAILGGLSLYHALMT